MNILFSYLSGQDQNPSQHYLRVLERLGHKVFRFAVPSAVENMERGMWAESGYFLETHLIALSRLAGFKPDLFIYLEPNGLIPRGMEQAPFPTACIISDTHQLLEARQNLARFFDHVFLYHRNYLRYFDEHPAEHVHWHPYAVDIEIFHPHGKERDLDVAFVGQLHPGTNRANLIRRLSERHKMNEPKFYSQKEIPDVYSRAKIVLNLPLADDLNFRTFEAMSCGAMLLTRRVNNGQEVLFEEGKHYVAFADEQELFEKVEYYLSHPEERDSIAGAGLAEVRLHHRLELRLEELLSKVKELPGRRAPIRGMPPSRVDRQYAWLYEFWRMAEPGLRLVKEARQAGRSWVPLLAPAFRSVLRVLFR